MDATSYRAQDVSALSQTQPDPTQDGDSIESFGLRQRRSLPIAANESKGGSSQAPGSLSRHHLEPGDHDRPTRAASPTPSVDGLSAIEMQPLQEQQGSAKGFDKSEHGTASIDSKIRVLWRLALSYVIALTFLGVHLGFFCYLDNQLVDNTIEQGLQSAIANILAFIIGTSLLNAIAVSYVEILKRFVSNESLGGKDSRKLMTLTSNPWYAVRLKLVKKAPWQWLLAWCCILLPIACNFPPGAMTIVEAAEREVRTLAETVDVSMIGKGSFTDWHRHSLFETVSGFNVVGPKESLKAIANSRLNSGDIYSLPGPCSRMCNYLLTIQTPAWNCSSVQPGPWIVRDDFYTELSNHFPTIFSARVYETHANATSDLVIPDILSETLVLQWSPTFDISDISQWPVIPDKATENSGSYPPFQINCTTQAVNITVQIVYDENGYRDWFYAPNYTQSYDIMPIRRNFRDILPGSASIDVKFTPETRRDFTSTQLHTIQAAAVAPLLGYMYASVLLASQMLACIAYYGTGRSTSNDGRYYNYVVRGNGTTIANSRFVETSPIDPIFKVHISPAALNQYLFDTTVAIIALNTRNTSSPTNPTWLTDTTVWMPANVYSFSQKRQFYLPYAFSLLTATIIGLVGIWCLYTSE